MKQRLQQCALLVLMLCIVSVVLILPGHALSWDGSSTGGGGAGNSSAPGGYAVRYSDAEDCVVGYRFSVIDSYGITQGFVIDVYKSSAGFHNPKFSEKYNKADLIRMQNNAWSTSYTTYQCYQQSQLGISLPAPSEMGTWQGINTNLDAVLCVINDKLSTNTLVYGDKVLVEPIVELAISGTYYSFTVTEMALYGKYFLGAGSNGGAVIPNPGTWGFIANFTNKYFPNLLYASEGYGIWSGVSGALTSRATFYDIINGGYGVGVAFSQTQNLAQITVIHYGPEGQEFGRTSEQSYIGASFTPQSMDLADYSATGYSYFGFVGGTWSQLGSGRPDEDAFSVTYGRILVHVYYDLKTYTIVFDGNGATTGSTASMTMRYNETRNLTPNGFLRTGYVFTGWNTRQDGSGTWFSDQQAVVNLAGHGETIVLYAQWQESLALEPIPPNAPYRETTEVITSYWLINDSDKDYIPADQVTLRFDILWQDGSLYRTVRKTQVVVPAADRNLVYIKWPVPEDVPGDQMAIRATLEQYGGEKILAYREYVTAEYTEYQTPDTAFEYRAPALSYYATPTEQAAVVSWSEYVYTEGRYEEISYQFRLAAREFELVPDAESAVEMGGRWQMKSGYGFFCEGSPLELAEPQAGYRLPAASSYTMPQYLYMLYPEFGYSFGAGKCTTMSLTGLPQLPEFLDYGRVHYTPLWYPDGDYTVAIVSSDCWTPMGMVKTTSVETLQIQGSMYDDWYVR